ncbi:hypothetical protein [Phaeovulum sp.]|uniref:hypothetical protein n=1 Tax=Phaeovulum sp. TaxID=2934796 RepID=UPI0039E2B0FF
MKAIAEYFRDLAADDRYFGAEPPTPDAEMLHRIAEREIQRRVDAKIDVNGVVLRPKGAVTINGPTPQNAHPARPEVAQPTTAPASGATVVAQAVSVPKLTPTSIDESVAAKLQRIRAAVANARAAAPAGYSEDQDADSFLGDVTLPSVAFENDPAPTAATIHDAPHHDALTQDKEEPAFDAESLMETTSLAAVDETIEDVADDQPDAKKPHADDMATEETATAAEPAVSKETLADIAGTEVAVQDNGAIAPDNQPQDAPQIRARVIKMSRAAEDTPAPAETQSSADDAILAAIGQTLAEATAAPSPKPEDTTVSELSPEAEAELMRDLANLENEGGAVEPAPADIPASVEEAVHPAEVVNADAPKAADVAVEQKNAEHIEAINIVNTEPQEADLSRLLDETNAKLEGTENRRRFSAIAHLKAAVAATVADRIMRRSGTPAPEAEAEMDRYREDLTRAVRPRRPITSGEMATRRPSLPEPRPAPLVLVSEQRIDHNDTPTATQPHFVRPRRIGAAKGSERTALTSDEDDEDDSAPLSADDAKNFADFAESLGVEELSDLLEAAAVYTATVEGRPHFSRPQIIKKVAALSDEGAYNREAGLRSFGTLLRQGKIARIKRGQFAITEQSRFYGKTNRTGH